MHSLTRRILALYYDQPASEVLESAARLTVEAQTVGRNASLMFDSGCAPYEDLPCTNTSFRVCALHVLPSRRPLLRHFECYIP